METDKYKELLIEALVQLKMQVIKINTLLDRNEYSLDLPEVKVLNRGE